MRIILISVFPPAPFPEADHAYHIARRLAGRGHDVHAISQTDAVPQTLEHLTLHRVVQRWDWSDLQRIAAIIRSVKPDAVIVNYLQNLYGFHPMMKYAATFSKMIGPSAPVISILPAPNWTRAIGNSIKRLAYKVASRLVGVRDINTGTLLRDSNHLVVLSENGRDAVIATDPDTRNKISVIPVPPIMEISPENDGAIRQRTRSVLGLTDDQTAVAFFGYLYAGKGIETLLDAFAIASKRDDRLRLVVIGGERGKYGQEMRKRASHLGLTSDVTWTGAYDWQSDQGSAYLRAMDIAVLPFDKGIGMHNSSVSAVVAHGLPLISTRGETLESPFINGTALLCSPEYPEALADAILQVANNSELRERLVLGARDLARAWYSWETAINRIEQLCSASSSSETSR